MSDAKNSDAKSWLATKGPRLERACAALRAMTVNGTMSVSRLTVAAGQLRDLADEMH